ncbi:MAG: MFS transporter [Microbispora sp.]|nr:MFS transporter [Microbispora sp.]
MSRTTSPPRLTLLTLATGVATFAMLQALVNPVLPTLQHDLNTSQSTVTWVITAWLLSASVATPLLGRIGDMIGKERALLVALAAIALGCLIAAVAPNVGVLITGRVVQGFGGAVFPVSFGIVRDEFPAARVPSMIGVLSAVIAGGNGVGIVIAGPIVEALGWRGMFWLPTILAVATVVLAHRYVPRSPVRSPGRINWAAAALLSGWLVTLLVPLSKATSWGWGSAAVLAPLAAAVVLFAAWIAVELRSRDPLIDMRMMRLPAVWTTNFVALLYGAGMFASFAFLPQFMQIPPAVAGYGFGSSVTEAGLLMLPMLVTMAVASSVSGLVSRVLGLKTQLVGGCAFGALSSAGIVFYHDRPWQLAAEAGAIGLGLGLAYAAMTNLIVQSVPADQTAVAGGMNTNIRTIGGSIGTAVLSSVIAGHLRPDGLPYESGFTTGFLVLTATLAATVAVSLLVPAARRQTASGAEPGVRITAATEAR